MFDLDYEEGHVYRFRFCLLDEFDDDFPVHLEQIQFLHPENWKMPIEYGRFYDLLMHEDLEHFGEEDGFWEDGIRIGGEVFQYYDAQDDLRVAEVDCYDMGLGGCYETKDYSAPIPVQKNESGRYEQNYDRSNLSLPHEGPNARTAKTGGFFHRFMMMLIGWWLAKKYFGDKE